MSSAACAVVAGGADPGSLGPLSTHAGVTAPGYNAEIRAYYDCTSFIRYSALGAGRYALIAVGKFEHASRIRACAVNFSPDRSH